MGGADQEQLMTARVGRVDLRPKCWGDTRKGTMPAWWEDRSQERHHGALRSGWFTSQRRGERAFQVEETSRERQSPEDVKYLQNYH